MSDDKAKADSFPRLSGPRKAQITSDLGKLTPAERKAAIRYRSWTRDEREFLAHLVSKQTPWPDDSPENKARGPQETK